MNKLPLWIVALFVFLPVLAETSQQLQPNTPVKVAPSTKVEEDKSESDLPDLAGRSIVLLKDDLVVRGRPCKRGWLRLHPNGVPASFTAAREIQCGQLIIPPDTWVMQNEKSLVLVCAFPKDTEIQGVMCRGTGGAKGVQVALYPSGALKQAFLVEDTRIQGVPCASSLISGAVEFYEDGRLKSCKLSEPFAYQGVSYKKGARLQLSQSGMDSVTVN